MTVEDLMREHGTRVRQRVLAVVGPEDVEDVTQEVWLRVWRFVGAYRGAAKPSTWLYRVATNTAISWLRTRHRRREARVVALPLEIDDRPIAEAFMDRAPDPQRRCLARLEARRVLSRLRTLPPCYQVAVLAVSGGARPADASRALGVPHNTLGPRLWRARRMLREA